MIEETTGQCETESAVPVGEIRITASKSMSIKHSAREDEVTNSMSPLRNPKDRAQSKTSMEAAKEDFIDCLDFGGQTESDFCNLGI